MTDVVCFECPISLACNEARSDLIDASDFLVDTEHLDLPDDPDLDSVPTDLRSNMQRIFDRSRFASKLVLDDETLHGVSTDMMIDLRNTGASTEDIQIMSRHQEQVILRNQRIDADYVIEHALDLLSKYQPIASNPHCPTGRVSERLQGSLMTAWYCGHQALNLAERVAMASLEPFDE